MDYTQEDTLHKVNNLTNIENISMSLLKLRKSVNKFNFSIVYDLQNSSRTLFYKIGSTSHSTLNNKINTTFITINTFTGVLGFTLWFYFLK